MVLGENEVFTSSCCGLKLLVTEHDSTTIVLKLREVFAQEHGVMSHKTKVFCGYDVW
jgi:hypothetical protein